MLLEAYIIPGIGCIFLFCLLSGCYYLQKMALTLKKTTIRIGIVSMSIEKIFLLFAIVRFFTMGYLLQQSNTILSSQSNSPISSSMYDRYRSTVWRKERNLYISTLGIIIWTLVIRVSSLLLHMNDTENRCCGNDKKQS